MRVVWTGWAGLGVGAAMGVMWVSGCGLVAGLGDFEDAPTGTTTSSGTGGQGGGTGGTGGTGAIGGGGCGNEPQQRGLIGQACHGIYVQALVAVG